MFFLQESDQKTHTAVDGLKKTSQHCSVKSMIYTVVDKYVLNVLQSFEFENAKDQAVVNTI